MNKIWKDIYGYDGDYQISNFGDVKSLKKNKEIILKPGSDGSSGYLKVGLSKDGKVSTHRIHQLVACAFIPNPNKLPTVNHKDGNKLNNRKTNLEWASYGENNQHAYDTGLKINKCKKFKAISPTGETYYASNQTNFGIEHGICNTGISQCLTDKIRHICGWTFEHIS